MNTSRKTSLALALLAALGLAVARPLSAQSVVTMPTGGAHAQDTFDSLQENAWYLPTADQKARLYVTSLGKGPTVIVLHGGPGNDFNYLVDAVRPQTHQHTFVLYDQRGSLLSPVAAPDEKTLTTTMMVEDLDGLRRALGEDKVVLLAHSWGTLLAMLYYQAHPEHVSALILVASFPPRTLPGATFDQAFPAIHDRLRAMRRRPAVTLAEKAAGVDGAPERLTPQKSWTRKRIEALAAPNLYHIERWPQFQGGGVYYNEQADAAVGDSLPPTFNLSPTLGRASVPIMVIQGDTDYIDPAARSWDYLEGTKGLKVLVIPEASHYPWIDSPALFQADLHQALNNSFSQVHNLP